MNKDFILMNKTIKRKDISSTFTQKQWERTVGYGKVPPEFERTQEAIKNGTSTDRQH